MMQLHQELKEKLISRGDQSLVDAFEMIAYKYREMYPSPYIIHCQKVCYQPIEKRRNGFVPYINVTKIPNYKGNICYIYHNSIRLDSSVCFKKKGSEIHIILNAPAAMVNIGKLKVNGKGFKFSVYENLPLGKLFFSEKSTKDLLIIEL